MNCFEFYYGSLSPKQKRAYKDVLKGILEYKNTISMMGLFDTSAIGDVMNAVKYDHAELFHVDFSKYGYGRTAIGAAISIGYLYDRHEADKHKTELEKLVLSTIKGADISERDSDILKFRKLHNYIVRNFEYDEMAVNRPERHMGSFSAFETLKNRKGVCEGISKAYKLICDNMNLKSGILIGESTLPGFEMNMNHAWNICQIEGDFFHIDVTWDMGISQSGKFYRYDYFGLTDERIGKDHKYAVIEKCITEKYDYFLNTKKDIGDKEKLKKYIVSQIDGGSNNIYFRIGKNWAVDSQLSTVIQKIIDDAMRRRFVGAYSYSIYDNKAQSVLLYKINKTTSRS